MKRTDNQQKYNALRAELSVFTYQGFEAKVDRDGLHIVYHFDIDGKHFFNPSVDIPSRPFLAWENIDRDALDTMVFNAGMVELISYWKTACPKKVVVKPYRLTEEQKKWWKKLYFNGLGEFFYLNCITATEDDFMEIESASDREAKPFSMPLGERVVVPIGGGKDSVVTLELLRSKMPVTPLIVNPRGATTACVEAAGFSLDSCIVINRKLDAHMLEMNADGYLNGHTPFSAMLAFLTLIAAAASGSRYIALSNESSANESTVKGTNINHQYSKSVEFESDFRSYVERYVSADIQYFSFLRPLSEMQIAMFFSRCKPYHPVFKSCNAGSKTDIWCGKCPKCLFTWIILSPFLTHEELVAIFGKDLSTDMSLRPVFEELSGIAEVKPFECVGTVEEVRAAICAMPDTKGTIFAPCPAASRSVDEILKDFNDDNFLPKEFLNILKLALYE